MALKWALAVKPLPEVSGIHVGEHMHQSHADQRVATSSRCGDTCTFSVTGVDKTAGGGVFFGLWIPLLLLNPAVARFKTVRLSGRAVLTFSYITHYSTLGYTVHP
jgi:hypothetical protein